MAAEVWKGFKGKTTFAIFLNLSRKKLSSYMRDEEFLQNIYVKCRNLFYFLCFDSISPYFISSVTLMLTGTNWLIGTLKTYLSGLNNTKQTEMLLQLVQRSKLRLNVDLSFNVLLIYLPTFIPHAVFAVNHLVVLFNHERMNGCVSPWWRGNSPSIT